MIDFVEDFLNYLEKNRSYSRHTIIAYRNSLEAWRAYLQELGAELQQINMPLARSYIAKLRRELKLSNRSINHRISVLKSFYQYLQKRIIADRQPPCREESCNSLSDFCNPWNSIPLLPQAQRLPNYLTLEELRKLADTCSLAFRSNYMQKLSRAILELGFSSGMRISELCSINVIQLLPRSGLNPINNLSIHSVCIAKKLKILGKGNKERFIFIRPSCAKVLADYLNERQLFLHNLGQKTKQKKNNITVEEKALFCNSRGTRLQPRTAHSMLAHLGRMAGLERPLYPHLIRHSFATTLLNHGANIRSLQELLGHKSLNSTQIYAHVGIQHLQEIHRIAHPRAVNSKLGNPNMFLDPQRNNDH